MSKEPPAPASLSPVSRFHAPSHRFPPTQASQGGPCRRPQLRAQTVGLHILPNPIEIFRANASTTAHPCPQARTLGGGQREGVIEAPAGLLLPSDVRVRFLPTKPPPSVSACPALPCAPRCEKGSTLGERASRREKPCLHSQTCLSSYLFLPLRQRLRLLTLSHFPWGGLLGLSVCLSACRLLLLLPPPLFLSEPSVFNSPTPVCAAAALQSPTPGNRCLSREHGLLHVLRAVLHKGRAPGAPYPYS